MAMMVREVTDRPYGTDRRQIDAIEALGEQYVALDAEADALTQRSLAVLAEFDRLRGWELAGHPSCAHWIVARRKTELHTAREKVRTARALAGLPLVRAAMARGELSFCQARALTRVATPDNEADLLTLAEDASVQQLERMIRAWTKGSQKDEEARARAVYESRRLSIFPDDDGGYVVKGRLTPEDAALLMRALEAASDALFREHPSGAETDAEKHREGGQRKADGLVLLAERAMAVGFEDADAPVSGTHADRYRVVLHVEPETLKEDGDVAMSELDDGTRVTHVTSQRVSCDASVVEVARTSDGTVVAVGPRKRTIPTSLRRALEIRDRGCRFPGCGRRFTHVHHVKHWADGGAHSLRNCLLLCRYHHRLVHEGGWKIRWDDQWRPLFLDRRGHVHYEGRWRVPEGFDDLLAKTEQRELAGVSPSTH